MGSCDHVVGHPALLFTYKRELSLAKTPPNQKPWVLLCHGGLFVDDLGDALEHEGYQCLPWDVDRLTAAELNTYVEVMNPSLVAAINYRNGLAEACTTFGLPLLCWEIDPTIDPVAPCARPQKNAHIFTWRQAHLEVYRQAGFPSTHFTPLASSTHRRFPRTLTETEERQYGANLCFVGASCTRQIPLFRSMLLDDLVPFLNETSPNQQPDAVVHDILRCQQADFSRFIIPELVAERLPGFVDYVRQRGRSHDPNLLLGEIAAAEKRLTYLANLAPFDLKFGETPAGNGSSLTGSITAGRPDT